MLAHKPLLEAICTPPLDDNVLLYVQRIWSLVYNSISYLPTADNPNPWTARRCRGGTAIGVSTWKLL